MDSSHRRVSAQHGDNEHTNYGYTIDPDDFHDHEESGLESDELDHLVLNPSVRVENDGKKVSWISVLKAITVEPIMFAQMVALSLTGVVLQNFYIDRICRLTLQLGDEVCSNLKNYTTEETHIEGIASQYLSYKTIIETGFPVIIVLFLGPWAERHGTKKPMLFSLFGYFLSAIITLIITLIPNAPPELILLSSVPVALVGGTVSLLVCALSFISKQTTNETRSFRIAMLQAAWFLGGPLGILGGSRLYDWGSFPVVFVTAAALFLTAFLYGCVFVGEEHPENDEVTNNGNGCIELFNITAVKETFTTVFARRSGLNRRWLLLLLLIVCLRVFAMFGTLQNMYLYTRHQFKWDVSQFTEYSVTSTLIGLSGWYVMIMGTMKIFKLNDCIIGIISTVGSVASQFAYAFGRYSWTMYLGSTLEMCSGVIGVIVQAMISKLVTKNEIVKVFTIQTCMEASMPLAAVPLYTYIFQLTIDVFAGAIFMISAGVYAILIIVFLYLYLSMKNSSTSAVTT